MVEVLKAFHDRNNRQATKRKKGDPIEDVDKSNITVGKAGWISPQYALSRSKELDLNAVEQNRCISLLPGVRESEYYKRIRNQVQQQLAERCGNTLMVTSVNAGEGKTVTAVNLAAMFAREFAKTVLLVDADLKQQCIHRYLGYQHEAGIVAHLLDDVPLQDIIVWPGVEKFTVISGGRTVDEGAELLNSPRMQALVQEMRKRYADRYIFFDVPALFASTDALSLAPLVDGIMVVVEAGKTHADDIRKALALLPQEKILGLVMNRQLD